MNTYRLQGGAGFCNAVRRSILSDVSSWAPYEVVVRENTSCQTDEFVAHRIGMIPFRKVGNGEEMTLNVQGRTALASDLVGPGFEAVHPSIPIMVLGEDNRLDITVRFNRNVASKHARYSPCAGVGMQEVEHAHQLSFSTNDGRSGKEVMLEALDALEARVDAALLQLSSQDKDPPKSMV